MSRRKKNKKSQPSKNKQSNVFTRVTKTIGSTVANWKEQRAEKKAAKQEEKELVTLVTEDMKTMANKMLLLEAAKRSEERAAQLRKMAEELV